MGIGKKTKGTGPTQSLFTKILDCVHIHKYICTTQEIPKLFYAEAAVHIEGLMGSLFALSISVTTP